MKTFYNAANKVGITFHENGTGYTRFYTGSLWGMEPTYFSTTWPLDACTCRVEEEHVRNLLKEIENDPQWKPSMEA